MRASQHWQRDLGPRFPGSLTDLLLKVDGAQREYLVMHLFASRTAYAAMDGDARYDARYRSLAELLGAEPTFTDVELAWSALPLGERCYVRWGPLRAPIRTSRATLPRGVVD